MQGLDYNPVWIIHAPRYCSTLLSRKLNQVLGMWLTRSLSKARLGDDYLRGMAYQRLGITMGGAGDVDHASDGWFIIFKGILRFCWVIPVNSRICSAMIHWNTWIAFVSLVPAVDSTYIAKGTAWGRVQNLQSYLFPSRVREVICGTDLFFISLWLRHNLLGLLRHSLMRFGSHSSPIYANIKLGSPTKIRVMTSWRRRWRVTKIWWPPEIVTQGRCKIHAAARTEERVEISIFFPCLWRTSPLTISFLVRFSFVWGSHVWTCYSSCGDILTLAYQANQISLETVGKSWWTTIWLGTLSN